MGNRTKAQSFPRVSKPQSVVDYVDIQDIDSPLNDTSVSGKERGATYMTAIDGEMVLVVSKGSKRTDGWTVVGASSDPAYCTTDWERSTDGVDLDTLPCVRNVDCYGDDGNGGAGTDMTVKLGKKSTYGPFAAIAVHNHSATFWRVTVLDEDDNLMKVIEKDNSFIFFYNPSLADWDSIHLRGDAIEELDPVVYGDFNNPLWQSRLSTGKYSMKLSFANTSNMDPNFILAPGATYNALVDLVNHVDGTSGEFVQQVTIVSSDFDPSNVNFITTRAGFDSVNAQVIGWDKLLRGSYTPPPPNGFVLTSVETLPLLNGVPTMFQSMASALTAPPVGFELDVTHQAIRNVTGKNLDRCEGWLTLQSYRTGGGPAVTVNVYSEHSNDNGVTWVFNENSVRTYELAFDGEGYKTIRSFYNNWPNDEMIRFGFMVVGGNAEFHASDFTHPTYGTKTGITCIWDMREVGGSLV